MPKLFSTLPLIAALLISSAVYAQEATTAESGDAAAPAETSATAATTDSNAAADGNATADSQSGEAKTDDGLAMGKEVVENPTYIKETYDDWQLKCFRNQGEGDDICQMYQLLTEDQGNPVAEFSMFRLPASSQAVAGATIVVPLGTLLGEELKISVDGGKAKSYPLSFCTLVGCFARIGFTQNDIAALKKGVVAHLVIVPAQAPDQKVDIKASLKGFTAAYENVSTITN